MKNNRGFSLIEMLVAVSIASGIGAAVFGFMIVGAKSFNSSGADVNVQHESQLVFNQIQDLVVDTNIGIIHQEEFDEHTGVLLKKGIAMLNYDPVNAEKQRVYEVLWDIAEEKLYYSEYKSYQDDSSGVKEVKKSDSDVIYKNELMGEHITDFSVDLTDMEKKRVVRLSMSLKKGRSTYTSSHNITLRNEVIEGGTIPTYMEEIVTPDDPEKVEGPNNIYAEPGQEIDLASNGYKVKGPGGSDYHDQDLYFYISDGAVSGTGVSTSGQLTVSKAQKSDFYVTVATRTGKGKALRVKVNLIIVTSVKVDLFDRNDGNVGNQPFDSGTEFKLEAVIEGRNLDQRPECYGIVWTLSPGAEKYVTMDASTSRSEICHFAMNTKFDIDSDNGLAPFEITATSVRSQDIPYYNGTNPAPVFDTFHCNAHKDKGDFEIVPKDYELKRGMHTAFADCYTIVESDLTKKLFPDDNNKKWDYVTYAGVQINRRIYQQEEASLSRTYILEKDVTNSASVWGDSGGSNLGITPPEAYEENPNAALEYQLTLYVFKRHENDNNNFYNLRTFQPGQVGDEQWGYYKNKADYRSNTISFTSDRLFLNFRDYATVTYPWGVGTDWNNYTDVETKRIKPRANAVSGYKDSEEFMYTVIGSSNTRDNALVNDPARASQIYKIYAQRDDGTWANFDDSTLVKSNSNLSKFLSVECSGSNLKVTFSLKNWVDKDIPRKVRVVPHSRYFLSGDWQSRQHPIEVPLFDNYLEIDLWNIEVPKVFNYQKGFFEGLLDSNLIKCYFPEPNGEEWYFLGKNQYVLWQHPFPANIPNRDDYNNELRKFSTTDLVDNDLYYKITCEYTGNGDPIWHVNLYKYDSKQSDQYVPFADYRWNAGKQMWELKTNHTK